MKRVLGDFLARLGSPDTTELAPIERAAVELGRFSNENLAAKRAAMWFTRTVPYEFVRPMVRSRIYLDGFDPLVAARPERGVVLVSNHRSFFDMYTFTLAMFELGTTWIERFYFPVRANFFYQNPVGIALNYCIAGGAMYPPIFREPARAALTQDTLDRVSRLLAMPGTLVGLHPEGTRGKGPDPYQLLPAQPGVGQIVLQSKPILVPAFINGLPNAMSRTIVDTYRKGARRERPIILVLGEELDYSELAAKKPRLALYKRCADLMNQAIARLGEREREIRAACQRGDIADDDPGWLVNRARRRGQ